MLEYIKKILGLTFRVSPKYHIFFLSILMFLNLIFELFGLVLFIPIASLILNRSSEYLNFNNHILDFVQRNILTHFNLESQDILIVLIFLIISIFFVKLIISITHNFYLTNFSFKIQKELGDRLFDIYLNQEYLKFSKSHSAEKIRNINNSINYFSVGTIALSTLTVELFMFVSLILILGYVNFTITIIASSFVIFFLLVFYLIFKNKIDKWSIESNVNASVKIKNLTEAFNSFKEILIYSAKKFFSKKFKISNNLALQPQRKFIFISMVFRPIIEFLTILIVVAVILLTLNLESSSLLVNNLIIFIVFISRLLPSINRINFNFSRIKYSKSAIETIYSEFLFEEKNNKINFINIPNNNAKPIIFKNKIELKNINFSYGNKLILKNLNFEINKGDHIGIYGKSGCGKSTFLEVLVGLNSYTGDIVVDKSLVNTNSFNWKKKFCYIPQNFYLLDESILKNILFGSEESHIDKNKLNEAIKTAQVDKFLDKTDKGLNTVVGEAGLNLSGGQKQRIALARAFYRNPEIILIDEATNSLDNETSSELIGSIKDFSKDITIVMVSHDTKVLNKMSKIYEMEYGKIK